MSSICLKVVCAPEWALFFEVANGTGSNIRRYADAVAMNLFPSRGLTLHGFELKVSRSDWQRELKSPAKVEEGVFRYCDHWWVVAHDDVVAAAELPPTWGLLVLPCKITDKGATHKPLRQVVAAPRLQPQDMSRSFIAALLRRASEADEAVVRAAVEKKYADRRAGLEEEIARRIKTRMREVERKLEVVAGIERQLGMSLTDWPVNEGYGRIIKALDATGIARQYGWLRELGDRLSSMAENISAHVAEFDAVAPDVHRSNPNSEASKE